VLPAPLDVRYSGLQSARHHCSSEAGSSNNSSLAIAPLTIVSPLRRTRKPPPAMVFCSQTGWASTTREPSATQESRVGSKVGSARSGLLACGDEAPRLRLRRAQARRIRRRSPRSMRGRDPALRAARPDGTRPGGARPCTSRGWSRSRRKDRHHRATRVARRSHHPRTRRRARPRRVPLQPASRRLAFGHACLPLSTATPPPPQREGEQSSARRAVDMAPKEIALAAGAATRTTRRRARLPLCRTRRGIRTPRRTPSVIR
jgi:hypothetical protein